MRKPIILAAFVLVAAASGRDAVPESPQGADREVREILDRHAAARGGREAWRRLRSARLTGTISLEARAGHAFVLPFVLELARPDRLRLDFELQDLHGTRAYDGRVGWALMPFTGRDEPIVLAGPELARLREQADLEGPLLDPEARGFAVRRLAPEPGPVAGALVGLELTAADGRTVRFWLDGRDLPVRKESRIRIGDQEDVGVVALYRDYRRVGGLTLPFAVEQRIDGVPAPYRISIETVELDVALDPARFRLPGSGTPTKRPATPGREE